MARSIAVMRVTGISEAAARAALLTAQTAPAVRGLVESTITLVYARPQPPEPDWIAAQAEALCRGIFPQ